MSKQFAETDRLIEAMFSDPNAVVTEAQVRAVAQVYSREIARVRAVEYVLEQFERAAQESPGHVYAGPWLAMVDDIRRVLNPTGQSD